MTSRPRPGGHGALVAGRPRVAVDNDTATAARRPVMATDRLRSALDNLIRHHSATRRQSDHVGGGCEFIRQGLAAIQADAPAPLDPRTIERGRIALHEELHGGELMPTGHPHTDEDRAIVRHILAAAYEAAGPRGRKEDS